MGDEREAHQVTVATFEIARYPLTNAQWKLFLDGDGYNPDAPWWDDAGRAWLCDKDYEKPPSWNNDRFGKIRPNHPVVGVSWYEAVAFCRWLTQHPQYNPEGYVYTLPSEAEWEYAARRATRRTYPWGNEEPDAERAHYGETYNGTSAVGCFPATATPTDGTLPAGGLSDGSYPVTATATNDTGSASTQYTLTVQTSTPAAGTTLYLPLIAR
jgi:formylglycine-generating enzyme required for sulfatase activity